MEGKELLRFVVNKDVKGFDSGTIVQGYYSKLIPGKVVVVNADAKQLINEGLLNSEDLNLLDLRVFNIN